MGCSWTLTGCCRVLVAATKLAPSLACAGGPFPAFFLLSFSSPPSLFLSQPPWLLQPSLTPPSHFHRRRCHGRGFWPDSRSLWHLALACPVDPRVGSKPLLRRWSTCPASRRSNARAAKTRSILLLSSTETHTAVTVLILDPHFRNFVFRALFVFTVISCTI